MLSGSDPIKPMHQVGKEGGSRRSASSSQSFMESLVLSRSEWSGSCRQWGGNWLWSHGYCFMADRSVSVGLRVRPLRASLTEGDQNNLKTILKRSGCRSAAADTRSLDLSIDYLISETSMSDSA